MSKTKDARRTQAEQRQAAYDSLSEEEKLARLDQRPGESRRERARLANAK